MQMHFPLDAGARQARSSFDITPKLPDLMPAGPSLRTHQAIFGHPEPSKLRVFGALPNTPDLHEIHREVDNATDHHRYGRRSSQSKLFGSLPNAYEDVSCTWCRNPIGEPMADCDTCLGIAEMSEELSQTRVFGDLPDTMRNDAQVARPGYGSAWDAGGSSCRARSAPPRRVDLFDGAGSSPSCDPWMQQAVPVRRPQACLPHTPNVVEVNLDPPPRGYNFWPGLAGAGRGCSHGVASQQRVMAMGATLEALRAAVPAGAQEDGEQDDAKAEANRMTMDFLYTVRAQATQRSLGYGLPIYT